MNIFIVDVFTKAKHLVRQPGAFFYVKKERDALCRVIDQVGDYKILKASQGYIVKNVKGSYKNHGHFRQLKTCYIIIDLIQKKKVPRSRYLRGATLRISTDKNYIEKVKRKIEKDRNKQKYINVNKGCRM